MSVRMDEELDLERCDENRENATRGGRRQRRVNNQRHGIGLRRRSITRVRASTADTVLFSLITILISLIQVKHQNMDASPFKTHPLSMAICLVALCIFALAIGFKRIIQTRFGNWAAHIINHAILISSVLVIVATVSVLVTNWLSWIIYITWATFSIIVVTWNWIHLIKQWRFYQRMEKAFFQLINVFRRFEQRLPVINVFRRMLVEPQGPSNV